LNIISFLYKKTFKILITLFLSSLTFSLYSQIREVNVKYIDANIVIDGVLDEAEWETTQPATDFWQYFPTDTVHSRNQTEIYMLYDDRKLYIGIKIYAIGNEYIVPSLRRDFRAGGSDNITLLFDTFNDGTNAFLFGSNTKWIGKTKVYDDYYITEWAIPLSAFKFREGETKWRFNAYQLVYF